MARNKLNKKNKTRSLSLKLDFTETFNSKLSPKIGVAWVDHELNEHYLIISPKQFFGSI